MEAKHARDIISKKDDQLTVDSFINGDVRKAHQGPYNDPTLFVLAKAGCLEAVELMLGLDGRAADAAEGFAMSCNIAALLNYFLKIDDIPPMEPNGYLVRECVELAKHDTSSLSHFDYVIPLALPFMPNYAARIVKGIARSGNWQLLANMSAADDSFLRKYHDSIIDGFAKEGLNDAFKQFFMASEVKILGQKGSRISVTTKGLFPQKNTEAKPTHLGTQSPGLV